MINYISSSIDFDKYHTFFLEYFKEFREYTCHYVRPCTASYEHIIDTTKHRVYQLDSAVMSFSSDMSMSEILLACAIRGINIDFIDILGENTEDRFGGHKVYQVIDTHKDDISEYLEKVDAPKHYVTKSKDKGSQLKFLVIDRFKQEPAVDFIAGEYADKAVVAGFNSHKAAVNYCESLKQ